MILTWSILHFQGSFCYMNSCPDLLMRSWSLWRKSSLFWSEVCSAAPDQKIHLSMATHMCRHHGAESMMHTIVHKMIRRLCVCALNFSAASSSRKTSDFKEQFEDL